MLSVNASKEAEIVKIAGDPFQLFETNKCKNIFKRTNTCLLGHNRYATVGKVNRQNAHPFQFSKVIGVHNGTLKNKWSLDKANEFDTDSEALYYNINEKGVDDIIPKIDGAYALVWYNIEKHSINFLRNTERPLYSTFSKDKKMLFWASEPWMLTGALTRENIEYDKIMEIPKDTYIEFSIPDKDIPFGKGHVKEVKQKNYFFTETGTSTKTPAVTYLRSKSDKENDLYGRQFRFVPISQGVDEHGQHYVSLKAPLYPNCSFRTYVKNKEHGVKILTKTWTGIVGDHTAGYYKVPVKSLLIISSNPPENLVQEPTKPGNKGEPITQKEFNKRYHQCVFCSSNLLFNEDFRILNEKDALCSACKNDPELKPYLSVF